MIYPDAPDDGTTPAPTYKVTRQYKRRGPGTTPYSTHPRAAYWREWKRKKYNQKKQKETTP